VTGSCQAPRQPESGSSDPTGPAQATSLPRHRSRNAPRSHSIRGRGLTVRNTHHQASNQVSPSNLIAQAEESRCWRLAGRVEPDLPVNGRIVGASTCTASAPRNQVPGAGSVDLERVRAAKADRFRAVEVAVGDDAVKTSTTMISGHRPEDCERDHLILSGDEPGGPRLALR